MQEEHNLLSYHKKTQQLIKNKDNVSGKYSIVAHLLSPRDIPIKVGNYTHCFCVYKTDRIDLTSGQNSAEFEKKEALITPSTSVHEQRQKTNPTESRKKIKIKHEANSNR